ncbi:MAG: hypothetical protein D3912_15170, partial [Candidatus Electrothrix sp. AX1]|nr:hypothetical protein [Candidatus Electrothrix sp. AX1]
RALAKHAADLSEDEAALREEMISNYGIDPLSASEFTYREGSTPQGTGGTAPPAADDNLFA